MGKRMTRDLNEILRDEMFMQDKIKSLLQAEPKTISEIATELGYPSNEVMIWVMSMRRYGIITEIPKERVDDYYRYRLHNEEDI
jgi:predicted Rossmann fold nucleotide-binding protein DprA/Smf involved in DNA uptake